MEVLDEQKVVKKTNAGLEKFRKPEKERDNISLQG